MPTRRMNRFRAAGIHFAMSAIIALLVFGGVFFAWHPYAPFEGSGGRRLFALVVGVFVAVCPLITLIVYVPGKKGLRFDLVTIALLQLVTLAFGALALYETRPAYIVFVKDRFELVRANDYPPDELQRARASPYANLPKGGPRIVGVRFPKEDPAEWNRILFLGPKGVDIQHMPQHYVAYEQVRAEVRARAVPIEKLRDFNPGRATEIEGTIARLGRKPAELAFLPLRGRERDLAVVIDRQTGDVLEIASLKPWEFK